MTDIIQQAEIQPTLDAAIAMVCTYETDRVLNCILSGGEWSVNYQSLIASTITAWLKYHQLTITNRSMPCK